MCEPTGHCTGQPDPETGEQTISRRRPPALSAFSQDPEYAVVLGLEQYDQSTQQASKAQIFSQRVHVRPVRKTSADSPGEALSLCLDEHGCLKFEVIARLLSLAEAEVPARLGKLVYEDPQSGVWQTAQDYLSGNVRLKLAVAERAVAEQPERFGRNVTALQALVPEDLEPEEIRALLGAPWIAPADLEQFCLETFGARPNIRYEALTASWDLTLPQGVSPSLAATSQWGTRALDAFRLVEIGLNKGVPVVYDTVEKIRVRNLEETLLAQDKLRTIQLRFSEWVWEDDERAERLAAVYNRLFRSVVPRVYDGSHLSFPGMDEAWAGRLYPWQRDFVWRMVCSRSALCAHPVGAGKTTTQIAGAMTLRRFGLISKAAIVVPNHLVEQITAEAQRLYPGARVLMVTRDDLSRERRKLFAARVALGDYDFVVMTHAGLFALRVHPETARAYLEQRIARYRQALLDLDEERDRRHRRSIKRLETAIEQMRQRQRELLDRPADEGVTFEQMGISYLIADECHLYKNPGLPTNIAGLQVQPSKRAVDLEMKLRWLEEQNQGRPFASFFSATPLANNMVEAYVQAWYLDQDLLRRSGLCSVDAFASTFIALETRVEVSPNGASFRLHTRPSRFVNMPELMSLLAQFADLRGPEILDEKRPQRRERTITIPPDKAVQDYVDDLVVRSEQIIQGRPRPMGAGRQDNMLWVTTHGRAAALDLSLVGITAPTAPKLEAVASTMLTVYRRVQRSSMRLEGEFQGLQIGFCDLGTPNEESEQVYGKLKQRLIEGGIPAYGIRYMQEARTEAAKERLFQQCRMGAVAVLLGSTALMGTGTNIQTRCVAIHHIDAPWRPDEVEQREGRGHRPGNRYAEVEIYRYVQQRTFDAYSWQTLTTKAVFFDQMWRGRISSREVDELGDTALSYAQVKAAATGDPLVLEQAELEVTIAQLQRLHSAHLRARKREAQEAERARASAERSLTHAEALSDLAEQVARCARPGFVTPAGELLSEQATIGARIVQQIERLLTGKGGKAVVGQWSGAQVVVQVEPWDQEYVAWLLIGEEVVRVEVVPGWMRKKQQWRFTEAIGQAITSASADAAREQTVAQRARWQAEQLERQAGQPFPRVQELQARLARKAMLDGYTALVAAVKEDPNRREELAIRRTQLLQSVPDYSLLLAASQPGLSTGPDGRLVPLFGQARPATVRRSRTRRPSDGTESCGVQLCLFPDLIERDA